MTPVLIMAAAYLGIFAGVKYAIDHDDPRESLRHDAAALLALAAAVAHFRSHR